MDSICRPSILSLETCLLSYGCHMYPCFHMTSPWPPFGLDQFLSRVGSFVVQCSVGVQFILEFRHDQFPQLFTSCYREESRAPQKFQFSWNSQEPVRIRSTWAGFDHIFLIRTQNRAPFFLWTSYSSRNILSKFQKKISQPAQSVPKVTVQAEFIEAGPNSEHLGLF